MYAFDFVRPKTLNEAVAALAAEDAQALGGGQTLIPTLKARLASPRCSSVSRASRSCAACGARAR